MRELKSIEENCRIGAKAGPSILSLSGSTIPFLPGNCLNSGEKRQLWLKLHPAPWSRAQRKEYNERFNLRIQEWLDAGVGSCLLENSELKQVMDGVLKFFDLDRYELDE